MRIRERIVMERETRRTDVLVIPESFTTARDSQREKTKRASVSEYTASERIASEPVTRNVE